MQRTALHFASRPCPRHGRPMELVLDDSRPGVSPLYWWCDDCKGRWAEEFFYFRAEQSLPIRALAGSFSHACPSCGSLDIAHACVVGCCDGHICNACGAGFDLVAELIEEHGPVPAASPFQGALDKGQATGVGGGVPPNEHPFTLPSYCCERHPGVVLKFSSFDFEGRDERFRFGWRCAECRMVYFDYAFRRVQRPIFVPASSPGIACPVCHGWDFDSQPGLSHARCLSCGSIVAIKTKNLRS